MSSMFRGALVRFGVDWKARWRYTGLEAACLRFLDGLRARLLFACGGLLVFDFSALCWLTSSFWNVVVRSAYDSRACCCVGNDLYASVIWFGSSSNECSSSSITCDRVWFRRLFLLLFRLKDWAASFNLANDPDGLCCAVFPSSNMDCRVLRLFLRYGAMADRRKL